MNPYILQGQPMQDVSGLQPVFQNFAQQQQNQQAALAQQNQQIQQAGQTQQGGGMNPMAMAAMLRKKDPTKPAPVYDRSQPMPDTPQYLDPAYMQAGY
jgi:hypothetical protein